MSAVTRWGGAALVAGAIGLAGWRARALTPGGAVAATGVGAITLARGGLPASAALVAFFVSGSALSRFKTREKARRGVLAQAKGGQRDAWQVLANGGCAAACLALSASYGPAGFLGALATAAGDTWATELGLLARRPPRLITTLRPTTTGTSGAITPEGTLAGLVGAALVATAWRLAGGNNSAQSTIAAGALGSLVDSLLGATVQAEYWCPTCAEPTEARIHPRCGTATTLTRGWRRVDNDLVNALATAAGAVLGMLLRR